MKHESLRKIVNEAIFVLIYTKDKVVHVFINLI